MVPQPGLGLPAPACQGWVLAGPDSVSGSSSQNYQPLSAWIVSPPAQIRLWPLPPSQGQALVPEHLLPALHSPQLPCNSPLTCGCWYCPRKANRKGKSICHCCRHHCSPTWRAVVVAASRWVPLLCLLPQDNTSRAGSEPWGTGGGSGRGVTSKGLEGQGMGKPQGGGKGKKNPYF